MLDFIVKMIYNNTMTTKFERPIRFSTKLKKINNLASACAKSNNNDFKAMWYHKLIDLAKEYDMLDYVMRKVIH